MKKLLAPALCLALLTGFQGDPSKNRENRTKTETDKGVYVSFKLTTDLSQLSKAEKKMIPLLIKAAKIMDGIFWKESFGDKKAY